MDQSLIGGRIAEINKKEIEHLFCGPEENHFSNLKLLDDLQTQEPTNTAASSETATIQQAATTEGSSTKEAAASKAAVAKRNPDEEMDSPSKEEAPIEGKHKQQTATAEGSPAQEVAASGTETIQQATVSEATTVQQATGSETSTVQQATAAAEASPIKQMATSEAATDQQVGGLQHANDSDEEMEVDVDNHDEEMLVEGNDSDEEMEVDSDEKMEVDVDNRSKEMPVEGNDQDEEMEVDVDGPEEPKRKYKKDDQVEVYWEQEDGAWFGAIVTDTKGNKVKVLYDDGDDEWVDLQKDHLRPRQAGARPADDLTVGSRVKIYWANEGEYYPGEIVEIDPQSTKPHHIVYDDGQPEETNLNCRKFKVLPSDETSQVDEVAATVYAPTDAAETVDTTAAETVANAATDKEGAYALMEQQAGEALQLATGKNAERNHFWIRENGVSSGRDYRSCSNNALQKEQLPEGCQNEPIFEYVAFGNLKKRAIGRRKTLKKYRPNKNGPSNARINGFVRCCIIYEGTAAEDAANNAAVDVDEEARRKMKKQMDTVLAIQPGSYFWIREKGVGGKARGYFENVLKSDELPAGCEGEQIFECVCKSYLKKNHKKDKTWWKVKDLRFPEHSKKEPSKKNGFVRCHFVSKLA